MEYNIGTIVSCVAAGETVTGTILPERTIGSTEQWVIKSENHDIILNLPKDKAAEFFSGN